MLGHTPQCSGVSTQVLAECTPALAGEGRKNQSLLVPNVLERAEERRSTLRELAKVARAEGRPRPPAVRTASRKGSNDQLQLGLGRERDVFDLGAHSVLFPVACQQQHCAQLVLCDGVLLFL